MTLLHALTRPVKDLTEAVTMPLRALFVVGLCGFINWMTFTGIWWVKWVALGMGIATVVALARGLRTLLLLALVAWVGWKIHQRWGETARRHFDDWAAAAQPKAAEVLQRLRDAAQAGATAAADAAAGR